MAGRRRAALWPQLIVSDPQRNAAWLAARWGSRPALTDFPANKEFCSEIFEIAAPTTSEMQNYDA
jgi:hypothetical protein